MKIEIRGVGWATFGVTARQGEYFDMVVKGLTTQCDIKNTYLDGSIRLAFLTVKCPVAGEYEVVQYEPPQAANCDVTFVCADGTYVARPVTPDEDQWIEGELMDEVRYSQVPLRTTDKKPHPLLNVLFDVRSYNDGTRKHSITVENIKNVQTAPLSYDVTIRINGTIFYEEKAFVHNYLTRWRQYEKGVPVRSDLSAMLPKFSQNVSKVLQVPVDDPTRQIFFKPGWVGGLCKDMYTVGGRPEIAPYPDWAVRYLVHGINDTLVLAYGDLSGSWPIHITEADGKTPISIDKYPNFWLDNRCDVGSGLVSANRNGSATIPNTGPLRANIDHLPSLSYIPYLMTGDRYHLEELKAWGDYVLIGCYQDKDKNARGGSMGLVKGTTQVRGMGWAIRTLCDVCYALPDNDPRTAYFTTKLYNNLNWFDNYAATEPHPYASFLTNRPENQKAGETHYIVAPWEHNILAWALHLCNQRGYKGGAKLRDKLVKFQLSLFQYRWDCATPYTLWVGDRVPVPNYWDPLKIMQLNFPPTRTPGPIVGYYGLDARVTALTGIELGITGAADILKFLNSYVVDKVYLRGVSDAADRCGWYLE